MKCTLILACLVTLAAPVMAAPDVAAPIPADMPEEEEDMPAAVNAPETMTETGAATENAAGTGAEESGIAKGIKRFGEILMGGAQQGAENWADDQTGRLDGEIDEITVDNRAQNQLHITVGYSGVKDPGNVYIRATPLSGSRQPKGFMSEKSSISGESGEVGMDVVWKNPDNEAEIETDNLKIELVRNTDHGDRIIATQYDPTCRRWTAMPLDDYDCGVVIDNGPTGPDGQPVLGDDGDFSAVLKSDSDYKGETKYIRWECLVGTCTGYVLNEDWLDKYTKRGQLDKIGMTACKQLVKEAGAVVSVTNHLTGESLSADELDSCEKSANRGQNQPTGRPRPQTGKEDCRPRVVRTRDPQTGEVVRKRDYTGCSDQTGRRDRQREDGQQNNGDCPRTVRTRDRQTGRTVTKRDYRGCEDRAGRRDRRDAHVAQPDGERRR